MFFDELIAHFQLVVNNSDEVIKFISKDLYSKGIVKKNFLENVLKRENEFPTGLDAGKFGVAIPHTDSKYVNKSQIAFVSLKEPVRFQSMVNRDSEILVSIIFLIAMSNPHEQAEVLTKLMDLFGNEELMCRLYNCDSKEKYRDILKENGLT